MFVLLASANFVRLLVLVFVPRSCFTSTYLSFACFLSIPAALFFFFVFVMSFVFSSSRSLFYLSFYSVYFFLDLLNSFCLMNMYLLLFYFQFISFFLFYFLTGYEGCHASWHANTTHPQLAPPLSATERRHQRLHPLYAGDVEVDRGEEEEEELVVVGGEVPPHFHSHHPPPHHHPPPQHPPHHRSPIQPPLTYPISHAQSHPHSQSYPQSLLEATIELPKTPKRRQPKKVDTRPKRKRRASVGGPTMATTTPTTPATTTTTTTTSSQSGGGREGVYIWNEEAKLPLLEVALENRKNYRVHMWWLYPMHPAVLDESNVNHFLCTDKGADEKSPLAFSFWVLMTLGM